MSDYSEITAHLKSLTDAKKKIGFDENNCNQLLFESFKNSEPVNTENIVEAIKAVKNPVEMQGMRNANVKSCASLI